VATHKSILLRLSEDLKNQVEARARTDRRTQSETLRIAIERFVEDREPVESSVAK
jgi:predicted DNA-binding protein